MSKNKQTNKQTNKKTLKFVKVAVSLHFIPAFSQQQKNNKGCKGCCKLTFHSSFFATINLSTI